MVIRYFVPAISIVVEPYMLPYIQEEIRRILYTWNDGIIGDYAIYFINKLHESKSFRRLYFVIHFCLFYLTKMFRLCLFINFAFFEGDLRFLVYFSVISFFVWLLSFLNYYLIWFLKANLNVSNEVLSTSFADPTKMVTREDNEGYIEVRDPAEVVFKLTPEGINQGFMEKHLPGLSDAWYRLNNVIGMFQLYKKTVDKISFIILGAYILCWFFLVKLFFFPFSDQITEIATGSFLARMFPASSRVFNHSLLLARDARFLKESAEIGLKLPEKTNQAHSPGHLIYGEEQPDGSFRGEGSLTTGSGTVANPSKPLLPGPVDAQSGKTKGQRYIPWKNAVDLPPGATKGAIPGSEQKLSHRDGKGILDKEHEST